MKKIFTFIALGSIITLSAISCNDFLDTTQRGVTSQEDFYSTDDEAEQAVFAVYDALQAFDINNLLYKNLLSDDAQMGGGSRTAKQAGNELNEFVFTDNNDILTDVFTNYYEIIYAANILLQKVSDDSDTKSLCRAEAKVLRAHAYFELTTLWGTPPLVTEPLEAGNYNQPNSTQEELWAQIETDLTEAIEVLPLKSEQSSADKARVSKGTAQSLLGKAYLYQEKYDEAAAMFDNVIESGEYDLYPDFTMITREESEFGVESIFEISYAADASNTSEGSYLLAYIGPRTGYFTPGTTGISSICWGWMNPLPGLHELFEEEGDEIRQRGTVLNEDDLEEYGASFRSSSGNLAYGSDGLVRTKYGAYVAEMANQSETYYLCSGMNIRLLRYADVLLMAAEAYNRKSSPNDTKALEYVNLVRARVELDPITETGDELFEKIKRERRMELAFEMVRFQDLVRWGDAAEVLATQGQYTSLGTYDSDGNMTYYENLNAGYKSYNNLLPFPETEISVNPNIVQNPGY